MFSITNIILIVVTITNGVHTVYGTDYSAIDQCQSISRLLQQEVVQLQNEIKGLEDGKTEIISENKRLSEEVRQCMSQLEESQLEHDEDEEEADRSNESHSPSRSTRNRRGINCESGTLATWACAPQCIFKLKGLCGLSLKSICHC